MLKVYCQRLGVSEQASLAEIKQAYRQKAKAVHPDRNQADDAEAQFVLLTYTFEDGLFGLRVLKSYQFTSPKNNSRP